MNKKDYSTINDNIRDYLQPNKKNPLNVIRVNTGNTIEHEVKKCEIAYKLIKNGHTIITEPELRNGLGRPDILVLDLKNPIAYEVMQSETEKKMLQKKEKYPFRIIEIDLKEQKTKQN